MKMREIIVGSVAVLTAAAIALTAGPLKADPPPAARQTRQQKIAELTAN
jgi:Spy/CpxP family protein refolding chaperone